MIVVLANMLLLKRPNRMQSSEKPYPWNITTSTPSGPVHISAAPGPSTGICGRSESANTQNRARQDNSSPSGKKARETKLAGPCKTPASQSLLQAAHALEQQESNLNALEARQESQNSYLKEELDRLRQEIAGMKRRNTHLEKTVEDLRSSRQAEMEEALLRQIHKRLNDSDELYKERFKELKHEVDEMKIKETTEIKPGLESVQKRVELLERFFKKLSAFDLLEKLQVEDANG
jgi:chromosome segregation ATPase